MLRASSLGLRLPFSRCRSLERRDCLCGAQTQTWTSLAVRRGAADVCAVQNRPRLELPPHLDRRDIEGKVAVRRSGGENGRDDTQAVSPPHSPRASAIPDGTDPSTHGSSAVSDRVVLNLDEAFKESDMNDARVASKRKGLTHHAENALDFWDRTSVPIQSPRPRRVRHRADALRDKHLDTLARTNSVAEAWAAYSNYRTLSMLEFAPGEEPQIPFAHLHRLARLITSVKPRTRNEFLQLYSVINTLRKTGGTVHLWEWNALMDCAGKGSRKTQFADYQRSLSVLNDILASQRAPGASGRGDDNGASESSKGKGLAPDVYTYTTLLNIAGRTLDSNAVRHALSLFRASKIPPNRITHLVLLRYFTHKNDSVAIRQTMSHMKEQDTPLDIAAVNAFIWAFARNGRLELAWNVYRVLRYHLQPKEGSGSEGFDDEEIMAVKENFAGDGLAIPDDMVPDHVTYHTLIQAFAYRGDVIRSLQVFVDMLSSPLDGSRRSDTDPPTFTPTLAAYRAIFYGFARYGRPSVASTGLIPVISQQEPGDPFESDSPSGIAWSPENLDLVFRNFLDLPGDVHPSDRMVWWIIVAFIKTSDADVVRLRDVWSRLQGRYPGHWSERIRRFEAIISHSNERHSQKALLDLIRNTL